MTIQSNTQSQAILALSGGVGGAKLALGLTYLLTPEQLTIVANTGDDFEHLGLTICPDLDTLMYTLAGVQNKQQGWGVEGESWNTLETLKALDGPSWFQLGDKDIATHLYRSDCLRQGQTLSQVTANLCTSLGIDFTILPMTNDPVRTKVRTANGELDFQHYFVRERCEPTVEGFYFDGIDSAKANPQMLSLLDSEPLDAIVICPSNPFVSVAPIIEMTGVHQAMIANPAPVIAVSPIIAGMAVKGPAAKMMKELNIPPSPLEVAKYYGALLDAIVIDESDSAQTDAISELGVEPIIAPIMMHTLGDKIQLAQTVLNYADQQKTLLTAPCARSGNGY